MHEYGLSAHFAIAFFLVALATEAIIELVKDSDISRDSIHRFIIPRYEENPTNLFWYTAYKYITCGQCMSVVYSIPGACFLAIWFDLNVIMFFLLVFAIQRATNWLNSSYKLLYQGRVTAIEFIPPEINMTDEYNPAVMLDAARQREMMRGSEQRVIINNVEDIKRIIKKLKETKPDGGRSMTASVAGSSISFSTSTNHPPFMDIIRDAMHMEEQADVDPVPINEGEQVVPLGVALSPNLAAFIQKCTGGSREGNRIKWSLSNGTYFYDPVTDKLTVTDPDE